MKRIIVQIATLSLLLATGLAVMAQTASAAPADRIAVVQIRSVDGLDVPGAPIQVTRAQKFLVGATYRVSRSAVGSLDGVKALVLIDRRLDSKQGNGVAANHTQEVLPIYGDAFTVKDADGKELSYTIDVLSDGSVDLLGPSDRIVARANGLFKIWKIERTSLVSRDRISLYESGDHSFRGDQGG